MKPDISDKILGSILCRTWKNPITGQALADSYQVDIRVVTSVVKQKRAAKIKIASSRGGFDKYIGQNVEPGYYRAYSPEEMASTAEMLRKTALAELAIAKSLMDFGEADLNLWEKIDEEAA